MLWSEMSSHGIIEKYMVGLNEEYINIFALSSLGIVLEEFVILIFSWFE
jgi:hypothetical protein